MHYKVAVKKPGTLSLFPALRCRETVHGREEQELFRALRPRVDNGPGLFSRHVVSLEQIESEFAE